MTIARIPVKYVAKINQHVLSEDTRPDYRFRYIDIAQVNSRGEVKIPDTTTCFAEAPSRARRVAPVGATVISTVRTYLRAIAQVPEDERALVFSTGFAVLEPQRIDPRFLSYACRSKVFVDEVVSRSTGVSYPAINPSQLGDIRLPLPSRVEQERIAGYLDDRVARIDQILTARAQEREAIASWRWLRFQAAASDNPLIPLRRSIRKIADGPFGSAFNSSDYTEVGPACIRLGNVGFNEFRARDLARIPRELFDKFPQSHVRPGSLLIASLGDARNHAGRACVAPLGLGPAMAKGKTYVAESEPGVATAAYLAAIMSSPLGAAAFAQMGAGSTRTMLNFDRLLSTALPLPGLPGQTAALTVLRRDSEWCTRLQRDLSRSESRLTEYKQSLITAAVTGEFDVTTASTRIPGEHA